MLSRRKRAYDELEATPQNGEDVASDQSNSSCSPQSSLMFSSLSQSSQSSQSSSLGDDAVGIMRCELCGQTFQGQRKYLDSNFQRHKREQHSGNSGKRTFQCSIGQCGRRFSRHSNMKDHERTHSTPKPPNGQTFKEARSHWIRKPRENPLGN